MAALLFCTAFSKVEIWPWALLRRGGERRRKVRSFPMPVLVTTRLKTRLGALCHVLLHIVVGPC